ncbi:MAG: fatty acid cis/trans isomerase [Bdellovibrionaceae bacterium]|nr:fatty acid cis/trans isomerase [Bdellovibrio sp.]
MILRLLNRFCATLIISLTGMVVQANFNSEYYDHNIKPIFASRCVQCHSCYNAPCQMNLGSIEGLNRGLVTKLDVFDPGKLTAAAPTRLGIDRKTTEQWRNFSKEIHFKAVTQDTGNAQKNIDTSFILTLVNHKKKNASLIVDDLAHADEMAENSRVCPDTSQGLIQHLQNRPNAGMPYGLPALSNEQIEKIKIWTEMGSPREDKVSSLTVKDFTVIRKVENYLNAYLRNSNLEEAKRQSLVSRYIYEHLFLAHIYLHDEAAPESFYTLIRSSKTCDAFDEIATRRPWDATGLPFFYCLKRIDATIVSKTHIPYMLNEKKLARWNQLFFSNPWKVSFKGEGQNLIDVAPRADKYANNPFYIFNDLPAQGRYQFLLDDAQYHVNTFIKGPVCKGNVAVNSIDEQFYVLFMKPESDLMVRNKKLVKDAMSDLFLPAHVGSGQWGGVIRAYNLRKARNNFRVIRDQYYGREFPKGYEINDIWNGLDESASDAILSANTNAALTVFRHEDSAAVVKGLVGATSKTVFVLDYAIFERIYYNLVVGFDVFGNAGHQVQTRRYMSFTKMEAEENFLSFLPSNVRSPMRRSWYLQSSNTEESIDKATGDKLAGSFPLLGLDKGTRVDLPALDQYKYDRANVVDKLRTLRRYRSELVSQFKVRLGAALIDNNQLNPEKDLMVKSKGLKINNSRTIGEFENELAKITDLTGKNNEWILKMPSASILLVESAEGSEIYTLARNKEHLNIAWLTHESSRRNEALDSMVIYKGVMTSYPNHIFRINLSQGREFLETMLAMMDHHTYEVLIRKFGNPRTGPGSERFWESSDRLHEAFKKNYPLEYGAFDYNRYGNDYRYNSDNDVDFLKNMNPALRKAIGNELDAE